MQRTPVDSQPPQASASTNSAIRADLSKTDEECQQNGDESSAAGQGEKFPDGKVGQRFRSAPGGDQINVSPTGDPLPVEDTTAATETIIIRDSQGELEVTVPRREERQGYRRGDYAVRRLRRGQPLQR